MGLADSLDAYLVLAGVLPRVFNVGGSPAGAGLLVLAGYLLAAVVSLALTILFPVRALETHRSRGQAHGAAGDLQALQRVNLLR